MAASSRHSIALPELSEKPLQPVDMTFPQTPFDQGCPPLFSERVVQTVEVAALRCEQ